MDDNEALEYIREYFDRLFKKRDLSAIDEFMHEKYRDDDIGDTDSDHIKNSKEYLTNWFKNEPSINVDVKKVQIEDNVISAYLEWNRINDGVKETLIKGIGIFELENMKIKKRHSHLYFNKA